MKILNLPHEYSKAAEEVLIRFDKKDEELEILFEYSDGMTVGLKDGVGFIRCNRLNRFVRLLGLFIEHSGRGDFEIRENCAFRTLSCMLDVSNGSAPTVAAIKEFCLTMALGGYNQLQLYLEDMYEMKGRPHFGYMRGRYISARVASPMRERITSAPSRTSIEGLISQTFIPLSS